MTDACDATGHCITCSDEGTPMRVLALGAEAADCIDERGDRHEVAVELVGPLEAGDLVLIHAGTAIERLEGP